MKICDACGQSDGKHTEVGPVTLEWGGYHFQHHTHANKKWNWSVDLCPKCAGQLKNELEALVNSFR